MSCRHVGYQPETLRNLTGLRGGCGDLCRVVEAPARSANRLEAAPTLLKIEH